MHEPYLVENPMADTLVLMIHGMAGSPYQFGVLAQKLYEQGYSVQSLLLPGHGGSAKQFAGSGRTQWEQAADQAVRHALLRYKKVVLIGHSMGCLLAIHAYHILMERNSIQAMILLAPPLRIHMTGGYVWNNIRCALGHKQLDAQQQKQKVYNSVDKGPAYGYVRWLPRYMDILKMASQARKQIRGIQVPVLAVHSQNDEMVSNKSVLELERYAPNCKVICLPNSSHFLYAAEDADFLREQVVDFLAQCVGSNHT